jgi:hypothetical protein
MDKGTQNCDHSSPCTVEVTISLVWYSCITVLSQLELARFIARVCTAIPRRGPGLMNEWQGIRESGTSGLSEVHARVYDQLMVGQIDATMGQVGVVLVHFRNSFGLDGPRALFSAQVLHLEHAADALAKC